MTHPKSMVKKNPGSSNSNLEKVVPGRRVLDSEPAHKKKGGH